MSVRTQVQLSYNLEGSLGAVAAHVEGSGCQESDSIASRSLKEAACRLYNRPADLGQSVVIG